MKKFKAVFIVCLFLITITACEKGEQNKKENYIQVDTKKQIELIFYDEVYTEMSKAYGFYVGQTKYLDVCQQKYPTLSPIIKYARMNFEKSFGASISNIDSIFTTNGKRWLSVKKEIGSGIDVASIIENYSYDQIKESISTIDKRAKGEEIPEPIIGTLLTFNPKYLADPVREMLDGFKKRFNSEGNVKAKGLKYQFDVPKSWAAKEGNRPNIVQKFVSQNGHGMDIIMTRVGVIPEISNVSAEDVKQMLESGDAKLMLPKNADFIKGRFVTIDNIPGVALEYKARGSYVDKELFSHNIDFHLYYQNKIVSVSCTVGASKENESKIDGVFNTYKTLFEFVAGSFVLQNQWKN